MFVADFLKASTGRDYAARWRGTYSTKLGAMRLLRRYGGMVGLASAAFGDPVPRLHARRGDPVLVGGPYIEQDGIGEALGICDGPEAVCLTENGLVRVPMTEAKAAWHV